MADREGSIYYQSINDFNFDRTFAFLAKEGISLPNKSKNGKIIALDDVGDDYEVSYEQVKQKALNGSLFNVVVWLNYQKKSFLTFYLKDKRFVLEFYLGFLLQEERDLVSKIFLKLFLSETTSYSKTLLGMFIDKNGQTYEYDFSPVFLTDSEKVDYVTDLICLPRKKFDDLVIMRPGFAKKELNNGFVCASRHPEFLNYVLS
ncbi:hypothetical protein IQ255_30810 [Pleurocapsales cyanobacterium LEGE 10410]|nr:hypothetical protein [Pleurocapsales cyanobacterium LEGE 10410]